MVLLYFGVCMSFDHCGGPLATGPTDDLTLVHPVFLVSAPTTYLDVDKYQLLLVLK